MLNIFRRKNKAGRDSDAPQVSENIEQTDLRIIAAITAAVLSYRSSTNRNNASNFIVKRIRRI